MLFFSQKCSFLPNNNDGGESSDTGVQTWPSERFLFRVGRASHCYGNMYISTGARKNHAKFKTTPCRCRMLLYGELAGFVVVSSCNCAENLKRERRGFAASHSPRQRWPCGVGGKWLKPRKSAATHEGLEEETMTMRRARVLARTSFVSEKCLCFIDGRGRRPEIDKTTPWKPSLLCVCPQLASLCRSCGADSRDRAGGLPRWIFMASFLLKTHKAKDSSRRSLTVFSGRMLRLFMGDQVVTSENSRTVACFAMPFVQLHGWLSRSSKRTSPLNGYFLAPFLLQNSQGWQPSVVISGRMLSLAYSSETGLPESTNWRDERLPKTDAHGCSCYHGLLMAIGTDKTKIWSLCEVFQLWAWYCSFSYRCPHIMFLWAGDSEIEFSVWTHDVCVVLRTMYQQLTVPLSEYMQLGLLHWRLRLPCSSAVSRNKHEEMWARLLDTTRFHAGNSKDTDFMWNHDWWLAWSSDDSFKIADEHGISQQLVQALPYIACLEQWGSRSCVGATEAG